MTLDRRGILGRWSDHLSRDANESSFRRRLEQRDEDVWARLSDLKILWSALESKPEFLSVETSYREGVEYLVQRRLRSEVFGANLPYRIVSQVRSNRTVSLALVQTSADHVLAYFKGRLSA